MNTSEAEMQAVLWKYFPIYRHIGLTVESARDGTYRCRLPLNEQNTNHINTVHAALQWAGAEVLGGLVVLATFDLRQFANLYGAVTTASIEFLRPARTPITAEALLEPQENERIRKLVTAGEEARFGLHATVRATDGEVVATLSAAYIVRPRRAAAQQGAPPLLSAALPRR